MYFVIGHLLSSSILVDVNLALLVNELNHTVDTIVLIHALKRFPVNLLDTGKIALEVDASTKTVNPSTNINRHVFKTLLSRKTPNSCSPNRDVRSSSEVSRLIQKMNQIRRRFTWRLLPEVIFKKNSELSNDYQVVVELEKLIGDSNMNLASFKKTAYPRIFLAGNNWIFISKVERYYKYKINDVAIMNKLGKYIDHFAISFEECQEGRVVWYELRFDSNILKLSPNVSSGKINGSSNVEAFLGVSAPDIIALNTRFILASPVQSAGTTDCRNYQKEATFKLRCLKSLFFRFKTPESFQLYRTESAAYVSVCSELIYLVSTSTISNKGVKCLGTEKKNLGEIGNHLWQKNC
ncbi:hypothetical protein BDF21DRAFT_404687 [Thamnidium elegans]|nr:hypothetical protein BDF21DRAFT_404687 [Thamnidium elegans]